MSTSLLLLYLLFHKALDFVICKASHMCNAASNLHIELVILVKAASWCTSP